MEESFISPGRAIEIHGLPQTLKKAKPDSLAHPGVFRNSGREYLLFYLINSFDLFLQLISHLFLYFIIFPAQEINFNGHSSSQKSIVTNGHQNGGFDAGVCFSYVFPSLHVRVSQKFFCLTISSICDLTYISPSHCSSSLERAYHSMYLSVC